VIQAVGIDQFIQHATVSIVAVIAALVVARRVLGVFERRPSGVSGPSGADAAPGCSHCASGNAAAKKLAHR
jgi:hypothetical protein